MKILKCAMLAATIIASAESSGAYAIGWPANYEGVMLQGFYWDSWNETGWSRLEAQSDELSRYFKLIWIPNSAKSSSNPGVGYDPVYWFTNHNTCWGTETELHSMIETFREKGTGIIEDVVINHRVGVTNRSDFPTETWNGTTWHIGVDGICGNDDGNNESGHAHGTGAKDTGWDFSGMCDLDHTNTNVQNNCMNYCKFLLRDMGYCGFRYDYMKGFGGQYISMYNRYSKPTFSVGEYWDTNYDAVAAWIEATDRESAAFDFPFKFIVNDAFSSGDLTKLVWKANGIKDQPAGMIHYGYQQLAVTFIDNHDTYREESRFTGNIPAANAYMICSPGTPCVFYPHWVQYKDQIKQMIDVRNSVGVHNNSSVTVLRSTRDCYMAEVEGSKGNLVVKIGSAIITPDGYSDSDIRTLGDDYCIWAKGSVYPSELYLIGNLNGWNPATSLAPDYYSDGIYTWNAIELPAASDESYSFFSFTTARNADWAVVNNSDRYGATSKDEIIELASPILRFVTGNDAASTYAWKTVPGRYKISVDLRNMTVTLSRPDGYYPSELYLTGNFNGWNPDTPLSPDHTSDGIYTWEWVYLPAAPQDVSTYFSFITSKNSDWGIVNSTDRYGAVSHNADITGVAPIARFTAGNEAASAYSWKAEPGQYRIVVDLRKMKVTITPYPSQLYLIGNLNGWNTSNSLAPDYGDNGIFTWESIYIPDAGDGGSSFSFVTSQGDGWNVVNASDRYGAASDNADISDISVPILKFNGGLSASSAYSWRVPAGQYKMIANLRDGILSIMPYPSDLYLIGNFNDWSTSTSLVHHEESDGVYIWREVELTPDSGSDFSFFSFVTAKGDDWNAVNASHRYGATSENAEISTSAPIHLFTANENAASTYAWKAKAGKYDVEANLRNMLVTLRGLTVGFSDTTTDSDTPPIYYNLQGIRVDTPSHGMYIVIRGGKVSKEFIR